MLKKDWSNTWVIVLLPILCVAIIYLAEGVNRSLFFACPPQSADKQEFCESIPGHLPKVLQADPDLGRVSTDQLQGTESQREPIALRYIGRINWFLMVEIFLFASLVSLGIGTVIASQLLDGNRILWSLAVLALSFLVGLFFYSNQKIHMTIFLEIFKIAITPDMPQIGRIVNFLNSLGNAAVFCLLIAICTTLQPLQTDSQPEGLKELSTRMRSLRAILYTGTFLLVTGVLLKKTIYEWSLAYLVQDETTAVVRTFLETLLTMEGVFYTLVLAAAYFPASLVLHRRAQLLVGSTLSTIEQEASLKEYGLTFSLKDSLPRILAILGPFLTGSAADLLSRNIF